MNVDPNIFRAYDIRGIVGKDLDEGVMRRIGTAIGKMFAEKIVAVGCDIRASSPALKKALEDGLASQGCRVFDFGTANFGEALFGGWKSGAAASLYVTASHLPPEWNGLKMYFGDGDPFMESEISRVRDLAVAGGLEPAKADGSVEQKNCHAEYVNFFKQKFSLKKKMRVVVDCGGGSCCLSAPEIFKALGFEVVPVFCDVDASFSNRPSEPAPAALSVLVETVKRTGADFGVAFDGDGDRAAIVDETGRVLSGNEYGLLFGKHLLKKQGGMQGQDLDQRKIVITVACSKLFQDLLGPLGAELVVTPVGHTFVIHETKKQKAVLGCEESGHAIVSKYLSFDDGLVVPIFVAEIMQSTGKKLSELLSEIPVYPFEEIVFKSSDEKKFEVVRHLAEKFKREYEKVSVMDGVRIDFEDAWVLVRAANTSPKIRIYIEARSKQRLDELRQKFVPILEKAISDVK